MKSAIFLTLICSVLYVDVASGTNDTVTGCDGYPCSYGALEPQPLTSDRDEAVLAARCHSKCLETVSIIFKAFCHHIVKK